MKLDLEIIREDKEILVCRKPAGIPVQTAKTGQQDLVSLLKNYRALHGEVPEIYVVHRLDQPVEGVMVFAKSREAAASLSRQMQEQNMMKRYLAVVEGRLNPSEGVLTDYLLRDGRNNISRVAAVGTKGTKQAVLSYRTLQCLEEKSLVEIQLKTGRHHQIRVQMAHAGHPLVGDRKYNHQCGSTYLPVGLCSVQIVFCHPITGQKVECSMDPRGEAFREFYESSQN